MEARDAWELKTHAHTTDTHTRACKYTHVHTTYIYVSVHTTPIRMHIDTH